MTSERADAYRHFAEQCVELAREMNAPQIARFYWRWRYSGLAWPISPPRVPFRKSLSKLLRHAAPAQNENLQRLADVHFRG
jgi:hypothetical protein